jgi:hypothetical protein
MESEDMLSEEKLVRKVSLDWLNHLHGSATSSYAPPLHFINSSLTLMLLPWKMHPSLIDAM